MYRASTGQSHPHRHIDIQIGSRHKNMCDFTTIGNVSKSNTGLPFSTARSARNKFKVSDCENMWKSFQQHKLA